MRSSPVTMGCAAASRQSCRRSSRKRSRRSSYGSSSFPEASAREEVFRTDAGVEEQPRLFLFGLAHGHGVGTHVVAHHVVHIAQKAGIVAETAQLLFRQRTAADRVHVRGDAAVRFDARCVDLAKVVAERRKHKKQGFHGAITQRGRLIEHEHGVTVDVALRVILGVLRHAAHGCDFGEEFFQMVHRRERLEVR